MELKCSDSSKKLEKKFRKGYKLACKDHVNLQWESVCVEKGHEALVKKLKVKIFIAIVMNEKDEQLEAEDARKEVDRDFFRTKQMKMWTKLEKSQKVWKSQKVIKSKMKQKMKKMRKN